MSLTVGSRLGHYDVTALIGERHGAGVSGAGYEARPGCGAEGLAAGKEQWVKSGFDESLELLPAFSC